MAKKHHFPHLHAHDEHSLRDGCATVETYADNVVELGGDSLCITNHGQAAGYARQYFACEDREIKPIFGMEAYINEHRKKPVRELIEKLKKDAKAKKIGAADKLARADAFLKEKFRPSPHAIILAQNLEGYKNLVRMSTDSWLNGMYYHPRTDTTFLAEHVGGLIYSTACIGGFIPRMARNNFQQAVEEAKRLQRIFEGRFYVELMVTEYSEQRGTNEVMMKLAHAVRAPMIITCDVHYSKLEDSLAQDVLLLMRDKKTLKDKEAGEGVWQFESKDLYWRTKEDVIRTWKDHHSDYMDREVFTQAMRNTYALADSIEHFKFDTSLKLPGVFENPEALLRELCIKGYRDRDSAGQLASGSKREYVARLHRELGVINSKGFAEYFVILWDIVKNARELGAYVGAGRGSAAGSLVSYLCRITDVDPLKFDLLFERFLDKDRDDPPDIDMDFDPEHRDAVKEYIERRYPTTATIGSFATFKPKATLNDVGRVFGIDYKATQALTKQIQGTDADDMDWEEIFELWEGVKGWSEENAQAFEVVRTLRGLISHGSKNAAGMLIAPASALDLVPLMVSKNKSGGKMTVTAFPDPQGDGVKYKGRELTRMGFMKMDILSVNGISVAPRAVEILTRDYGETVDLANLHLDDEDALAIASDGDVPGVFQLDTHATRPILKKVGVDSFMDLAMVTALVRPGPLKHGIHNKFAKLKRSGDSWREEVPEELQQKLYASRGLMILQEDVMWVCQIVAGWTFNEANGLRKTISKKYPEAIKLWRGRFVDGAVGKGHDREEMEELWEKIKTFSGYGFCKAHAVSYMLTSYQQIYMLAHHPVCYFAALLQTTERSSAKKQWGEERIVGQMRAAMGRGVKILPPSLSFGGMARFDVKDRVVHYGLRKVKGIGEGTAEVIEGFGPQASLEEFYDRVIEGKLRRSVTKTAMVNLILCGAMDDLGLGPTFDDHLACGPEADLGFEIERGIEYRNTLLCALHSLRRDKGDPETFTMGVLREKEKEALGLAFSWWASDVLEKLREEEELLTISQAVEDDLLSFGLCVEITRCHIHKGKRGRMAFVGIGDETGTLDGLTIWSQQLSAYKDHIKKGRLLVLRLRRVENEGDRRKYGRYSYHLRDKGRRVPVQSVARLLRRRES